MFTEHQIPVPARLRDYPVQMPINVLLAVPDYVVADTDRHIFNVPGAVNELMGGSGWRVATQVMKPRVWAPAWDEAELRAFVTKPFGNEGRALPERALRRLRARAFPGLRSLSNPSRRNYPEYEIIHFVGVTRWGGVLDLGIVPSHLLSLGKLIDALAAARTRLLILQVERVYFEEEQAELLARYVVGSGGPAVLVVSSDEASELDDYFLNLYAEIIHNRPLTYAAQPRAEGRLFARLFYGDGGEDVLSFEGFREKLYDRIRRLHAHAAPEEVLGGRLRDIVERRDHWIEVGISGVPGDILIPVEEIAGSLKPFLHEAQVEGFGRHVAAAQASFETKAQVIREQAARFESELDWSRETGGAIPLSAAAVNLPRLEAAMNSVWNQFSQELAAKALEEAERAPRVLNANFFDPRLPGDLAARALASGRGLEEGEEYELCVDVGPQWSTMPSIVEGSKEFPERALPVTEQGGHLMQVVFVSEDFSPHMSSAQIWVPSKTGRSSPFVNGERALKPGPVSLRLRAPSFPEGANEEYIEARGRLCLYFGNNLLQSAAVRAAVVRRGVEELSGDVSNEIYVDFRLTGTFQELERFATRAVVSDARAEHAWLVGDPTPRRGESGTAASEGREFLVGLNLTLNDDGSKHRILVKSRPDLPPAWKPYNVLAAAKLLGRTRQELYNCFFQRDQQTCEVPAAAGARSIGLNAKNGKDYYQFFCDLRKLAIFGERLFNEVYQQINLDGAGMTKHEWETELRESLARSTVIQVARTGEAEYAFPWALVYQYPLDDKDNLRPCEVLKEWNAAGMRAKGVEEQCPHEGEPWHGSNILCPYGFWGLKHYIEQPIPPLVKVAQGGSYTLPGNVPQAIEAAAALNISVGVTRDPQLSLSEIKEHLENLAKISSLNPPDGADEWLKVQGVLKSPGLSPDIVYFLCHGEYDDEEGQPYLGIGLPSGQHRHRVYPNDLLSWSRRPEMTSPVWKKPRPLIFINGCHTFALLPDQVLNFVSTFADFGASGVIGTEVSILLPLAIEIAEMLFDTFINFSMKLGQAMHQVRWKLANKGNLLGLAYTPYGQADLHLVKGS
jgi:hypothetical protein